MSHIATLENNSIPILVADDIFNNIDDSIWKDPDKKFCYASIVDDYIIHKFFDKLNEGLKDIIKDDIERRDHILNNMIYGIALTKARARLVKAISIIKNIYVRNIIEENTDDMPKFDFIIQNPPYNKSLHLDFLKKGYEMLSDKGQMVIIEPATWLINVRKTGKAKKYDEIKAMLKDHVKKVVVENYNKEFNTGLYVPFSITYIDKKNKYKNIDAKICGEKKEVRSLYDVNLVGNYDMIWSILNKIDCDKLKNHTTSKEIGHNKYVRFMSIITAHGYDSAADKVQHKRGIYYGTYITPCVHKHDNDLYDYIPQTKAGNPASCVYGTEQELENWKHFVFNNSLPLFINIVMTIDQHNNSLDYVPWLVDKQYTDDEIYKVFNFTNEEIKLIETTIKKYEWHSLVYKRKTCGPEAVSDEEVQNYIKTL